MIIDHPVVPMIHAFELKAGHMVIVSEAISTITAVEKMDGDSPTFVCGGPDGNTAVAIKISFDNHEPIMKHPQSAVRVFGVNAHCSSPSMLARKDRAPHT